MEIRNISQNEIINVVNEYIRNEYEYDYADILDDCIIYHLDENNDEDVVVVYINVESERD